MLPPNSPRAHLSLPFLIFSLSVFPFFPPFSSLFLFFSCLALFVRFLPLFLVLTLSFLLFPFLHVPFPLLVFLFLPFLSFLSFSFLPFHFFPFLSFPSFFLPLSLLSFFLIVFFSYIRRPQPDAGGARRRRMLRRQAGRQADRQTEERQRESQRASIFWVLDRWLWPQAFAFFLIFLSAQKATLGSGACLLGAASVLQCHGVLLLRNRPLGGRCGAVLRAWELHFGAGFLSVQKATLGTGACLLGAASVLQCHGVLLFRNRPLRLRCGAVLRAWELHFGAGFLSAQKATLGSGACLLGAASVLQCHGVLLFRNRSLGGRCGTILRACELHFGAGFLSVQKATLGSGPCLLGAASVLQCHGVLLFRNRPLGGRCGAVLRAWELHFRAGFLPVQKATLGTGACLLGADRHTDRASLGAALWSWFLVGSEGNVRQWSLLARPSFSAMVFCCFGTARWEVAVELF